MAPLLQHEHGKVSLPSPDLWIFWQANESWNWHAQPPLLTFWIPQPRKYSCHVEETHNCCYSVCVYLPHVIRLFCFLQILNSMGAYWLMSHLMALLAGVLGWTLLSHSFLPTVSSGWSGMPVTWFGTFNTQTQGQGCRESGISFLCSWNYKPSLILESWPKGT